MLNAIRARWEHTSTIGRTWWTLLAAIWGLFWAADAAIEKWDFGVKVWWAQHTTHLPSRWEVWLIVFLTFLILGLIEGSFRQHSAITARLKPKAVFKKLDFHTWDLQGGEIGTQYYVEVFNSSTVHTIHDVRVQLMEIAPLSENIKTPVFLHIQHDAPERFEDSIKSFDLNPEESKNVDLVAGASHGSGFRVCHVSGSPEMDKTVSAHVKRVLRVEIKARDLPPASALFSVEFSESGKFLVMPVSEP
jgi:hypothetical protein